MKIEAAYYTKTGKAEDVLQIGFFELEDPKENEVQVEIIMSGINPSDIKIRSGIRGNLEYPYMIPHSDGAGIIRKLGYNVTNFAIGDKVWVFNAAWNRCNGTASSLININSSLVVKLTSNTSFETGACLGVPGLTAASCLLSLNCKFGDIILITGGAGSVGVIAIQLAKILGFKVITTVSSLEKEKIAYRAGADLVINYKQQNIQKEIMLYTNSSGLDGLIDVDFGANITWAIDVLKDNTVITTYASASELFPKLPFYPMMFKQIILKPIFVYNLQDDLRKKSINLLQKACEEQIINPLIYKIYPLKKIIAAHNEVESKERIGQVLLKIGTDN